ncbi:MAG: SGNH/GDSL hydrolase family protein [Kiritimatiellia bacterium]|jgi:acyl-CoA thioesterase-1|nr:SGNH/GDSL hydrolase family protein [Kiritimatiellia bacterium]
MSDLPAFRFAIACVIALPLSLFSAPENTRKSAKQKRPQPAFAKVIDKPNLPRVLLIGDSISMGYTADVRKLMEGKANVHRPPTNCGPTTKGLVEIDQWLGEGKWDVIHFNWGLHDLKYMSAKGGLADVKSGKQQVEIGQYERNLDQLVVRLKKTGARLIWRNTTPVPPGAKGRVVGDAKRYNDVALKVMKKHQVAVQDMHAFVLPRMKELMRTANVHFTPEGSRKLAETVVGEVDKAL